jgi:Replication initiator protein A
VASKSTLCLKQLRITEQLKDIEAKRIVQPVLFPTEEAQASSEPEVRQSNKLLSLTRLSQGDYFAADLIDCSIKSDMATMEAPFFSLRTNPDLKRWHWESKDGKKVVEVVPSVLGRATIHDKDVLIYIASQMTEALNRSRVDAKHRIVRFSTYDYLRATNKNVSGKDYDALEYSLRRLSGTRIFTNIMTGGQRTKTDFGFIDSFQIAEKSSIEGKMMAVRVTISEWLFWAIQNREVLTYDPAYFKLRKTTDRRIYEIVRKHCGYQSAWTVGLSLLHAKSGSCSTLYEFHKAMKELVSCNHLPEYWMKLTSAVKIIDVKVHFYRRDKLKSILHLVRH